MGLVDSFVRSVTGGGLIDRLCREAGWSVDERDGRRSTLYFNGDRVSPRRDVHILHGPSDPIASFFCMSRAVFSADRIPDTLMPALLVRNQEVSFGGWQASFDRAGDIVLSVTYTAPAAGLDARLFVGICRCLVEEVAKLEATLRNKGLL